MAHDVFISYAHDDRTVANAVVATLESHGIRCWIAPRDIVPGEDWGEAIIDALKEAHALVLVFSSHSNASEQIKREVERTVHQGIAVIPFRIEDVLPSKTLEYFISTQHWLDALTPPLEDHLAHLADTITVLLAKKGLREKPLHVEGGEPAPPRPEKPPEVSPPQPPPAIAVSASPRKIPLIWLIAAVALLVGLGVAGGIWWRWSQPVVPASKVAPPPVAQPPVTQPPVTTTPPGPVVSVKDGKFVIAPEAGHWKVVTNQDTILPNDMDASVSLVYQRAEDPNYSSGLVFWVKDYNDYYVLALAPSGSFGVQRYTGKRWLQPISWRQIDAAKKGENAENILRVVTKGNEATAYINGKEIISFTGEPPQGGSLVGFKGSSGPKGVNAAAFANLKVIGPSQVLGFQPDPKQPDIIRLSTAPAPSTAEPAAKLSATDYYNKGHEAKDPEQKIEFFTKAIGLNPYNAQYYYYRGLAYKTLSRFPLAIEDFTKAITYQANYPSAFLSRGDSYSAMGQQDKAIADFTQAISLEPLNSSAFLKRAIALQKKGDSDKALADYTEVIKLKPDDTSAFNNRGLIYYRMGKNDKALADYNEAIRLNPKHVLAYRNRGALYERMGDKDRAAEDRNQAKALDPEGKVHGF